MKSDNTMLEILKVIKEVATANDFEYQLSIGIKEVDGFYFKKDYLDKIFQ